MRLLTSIMLSTVLVAVNGCSVQNQIIGKWNCKTDKVTYADGQSDRYEYTSDGKEIIQIADGSPQPVIGGWKSLDNNRFTSIFDGKESVTTYKFEGEKLLFKSASSEDYSIKCDRVK